MSDIKHEIEQFQELANIHAEHIKISESDVSLLIKENVRIQFYKKFEDVDFDAAWEKYMKISPFSALGNIYDTFDGSIDIHTHYVMRLVATWHIERALTALKFDTVNDHNLKAEPDVANIGTAGRIAKIWAGNGLDSENIREYGDGRWTKPPRLATFPAEPSDNGKPVVIKIENAGIGSVCSHHFLPFSIQGNKDSRIVVSYIPNKNVLGLSKVGRFVEWCLNRPSLQEEVTSLIHRKIKEIAETDDVYVGLIDLVHSCEVTRGAKQFSTTTTEEYSGAFDSYELRASILK